MLRFTRQTPLQTLKTQWTRTQLKSFSTPARQVPMTSKRSTPLAPAKPWNQLSTPQKVAVASKTTFNMSIILAGVGLTSMIVYYIGSELFSSQSPTSLFNEVVDRIRLHDELVALLGQPIKGHGEPSRNSRRRNRRIASQVVEYDNQSHLLMRFYVEGPLNQGTVSLDMVQENGKWQFKKLFVDVPGQGLPSKRIYLENY